MLLVSGGAHASGAVLDCHPPIGGDACVLSTKMPIIKSKW